MGTEAPARFDPAVLERLAEAEEVQVVTRRRDGSMASTPIWVVVVDGAPYVRSYTGRRGRWWRRVLRDGRGLLVLDGGQVPFVAQPLDEEELDGELNRRVSEAYREKYGATSPGPTRTMVSDREVVRTTLRLLPPS